MSLTALVLLTVAQAPTPFERPSVDPFLPDVLHSVVSDATAAELDPKRGPGNALAVFEEAKKAHGSDDRLLLALRLREAGVLLRQRFLTRSEFPEPIRYEQAISTFARLDLAEPGLGAWIERTLEHHPEGKAAVRASKRKISVAFLTRGAGLDKKAVAARFAAPLEAMGFHLAVVPPKKAHFVLKLATENPRQPVAGQHAVRVLLGIEGIQDGKVVWTHTVFRTEAAPDAKTAIDSALVWLARVGGRDMFFQWLGQTAFPTLIAKPKNQRGHEGHGH